MIFLKKTPKPKIYQIFDILKKKFFFEKMTKNFQNNPNFEKYLKKCCKIFNFLIFWKKITKTQNFTFFGNFGKKIIFRKNDQKFPKNAILCMWYWKMQRRAVSQFLAFKWTKQPPSDYSGSFAPTYTCQGWPQLVHSRGSGISIFCLGPRPPPPPGPTTVPPYKGGSIYIK